MPELPEIETVKRTLEPHLQGRRIVALTARRRDPVKHPDFPTFAQGVAEKPIRSLGRRGKYLCLHLADGSTLVAHLRMTGRLVCVAPETPEAPHTHLIFRLDDGKELRFSDVRRFGCLWWLAPGEEDPTGMAKLGPEPLGPDFTAEYLRARLGMRRLQVKQGLLDQTVIAGLGNIYADEAMFRAGVRPDRLCCTLTEAEWSAIHRAIPPILEEAIRRNGTTFSDFLDGEGREGQNQPFLLAYQHGGQPCARCGAMMEKIRVGGRGTCFCPVCQK